MTVEQKFKLIFVDNTAFEDVSSKLPNLKQIFFF